MHAHVYTTTSPASNVVVKSYLISRLIRHLVYAILLSYLLRSCCTYAMRHVRNAPTRTAGASGYSRTSYLLRSTCQLDPKLPHYFTCRQVLGVLSDVALPVFGTRR